MATPYLGELRLVSFNFAPRGWALCNGQLMAINQNQALFALLGTFYGGNGTTTFALPNLQGRSPMHMGAGYVLGQMGGEAAHTLTLSELPAHLHTLYGVSDIANANAPGGALPAAKGRGGLTQYGSPGGSEVPMAPSSVAQVGGGQPHENMPPYLVMNMVIALQGIFPSQN